MIYGLGQGPVTTETFLSHVTAPGAVIQAGKQAIDYVRGFFDPPEIDPPDLTPVAPQVGFTPETVGLYTGERRVRDVEMTKKAVGSERVKASQETMALLVVGVVAGLVLIRR